MNGYASTRELSTLPRGTRVRLVSGIRLAHAGNYRVFFTDPDRVTLEDTQGWYVSLSTREDDGAEWEICR